MDPASLVPSSLILHLKSMNEFGVWTGGYEAGKMDALNSTSFLGGLRYWSEALLRAENRPVCMHPRCSYDSQKKDETCDLCKIFGCTGISRAFALKIRQYDAVKNTTQLFPLDNCKYKNKLDKTVIPKYYARTGYCGDFDLTLSVLRPLLNNKSFVLPDDILTALYLMIEYGTLGAYDQYGCGIVGFKNEDERQSLLNICKNYSLKNKNSKPNGVALQDFFFFKGNLTKKGNAHEIMFEIRHSIRNDIRQNPQLSNDPDLRHWVCGYMPTTRGAAKNLTYTSKYVFSIDNNYHLYGWGTYERNGEYAKYASKRNIVLKIIYDNIRKYVDNNFVWRECASSRDTSGNLSWPEFFSSLLSSPWRTL